MARATSSTDLNGRIAALLRDLAAVQKSQQSMWGYKRAAAAILALEEPIESFLQPDGTLRKIPNIGPSSSRVILEVLRTGSSPTVEAAVAGSGRAPDVEKSRGLRTNFLSRAQVVAALKNTKLRGPKLADYRGDLQMHSEYSDGGNTLREIADACIGRGYSYCAVTDHSYGLPIAHGVSMANLVRQHREIERLNRDYDGRFRMLKGIEANIRSDGRVDMEPGELATLEIVVASPHSALRSAACSGRGPGSRLSGRRCSRPRPAAASRSRSTAIRPGRISISSLRPRRSTADASSPSTATPTRSASSSTRKRRSRTPVTPACRATASSTRGRSIACSSGRVLAVRG